MGFKPESGYSFELKTLLYICFMSYITIILLVNLGIKHVLIQINIYT
jgi:hypothetical protein